MNEPTGRYHERIVSDPRILGGKPIIKGTRIAVDLMLEELSHNLDVDEMLAAHPDLSGDDVQACLAYAQAVIAGKKIRPELPRRAASSSWATFASHHDPTTSVR